MIRKERVMDLGNRITITKERKEKLVEALSRSRLMEGASSVAVWVILLMIARRVIVATSVGKRVTRHLSVRMPRRKLLVTIVVRMVILVLSVPSRKVFALNAKEVEQPDNLI